MMPRRPMRPMTLVVDAPAEKPRAVLIEEGKGRRQQAGRVIRRNASHRQCRLVHAVPGALLRPETLVSRHGSDVVGCAQPWERSERRIAQPIPSVLASDATPRCAPRGSAYRNMIGEAT